MAKHAGFSGVMDPGLDLRALGKAGHVSRQRKGGVF